MASYSIKPQDTFSDPPLRCCIFGIFEGRALSAQNWLTNLQSIVYVDDAPSSCFEDWNNTKY